MESPPASPLPPAGKGSDSITILSTLVDVSARDDDEDESAPSTTKSRPTTPISVSWPAADDCAVAGSINIANKRDLMVDVQNQLVSIGVGD